MNNATRFSPEVRERAVRMVQEGRSQYPSLSKAVAIAPKIGYDPATLLSWTKRDEALMPQIQRVFDENWQVEGRARFGASCNAKASG